MKFGKIKFFAHKDIDNSHNAMDKRHGMVIRGSAMPEFGIKEPQYIPIWRSIPWFSNAKDRKAIRQHRDRIMSAKTRKNNSGPSEKDFN